MTKRTLIIPFILTLFMAFYSCSLNRKCFKSGDILTLQPGAKDGIDAYIENYQGDNYPNRNWGDYDAFAAVAWTAKGDPLTVRCLLKFDLHKIRAKAKIKKATLSLYAVSTPGIGTGHSTLSGPNDFVLKKITSPWEEHKVTWNTQPSVTDKNEIILLATNSETQDFTDIDMTDLVQEMIEKPGGNYGLMISLMNENHYRRVIFGSSDNANSQKRPKLVIEF
jgi:hypothetical protein